MAAGRDAASFHPDNPIWWIVQGGEVRFTIEGRNRSSRPVPVQVPYRNIYQIRRWATHQRSSK
jgi:hypothetical protein